MQELVVADIVGEAVPGAARGAVHSVFSRACNIETVGGQLLTVLSSEQGNLPRGIRLARARKPFAGRLEPGQFVLIAKRVLQIAQADLSVDFSDAALFRGTIAVRTPPRSETEVASALTALRATVSEHLPKQGIAPVLLRTSGLRPGLEQALAGRVMQALPHLTRATARRDFGGVVTAARQLLGLGPGLTPSGDDFLVGYLAALWSRRREDGMEALLEALPARLASLLPSTNAVSRQMLRDASLGRFPEIVVDVAQSLYGAGEVVACARRALAIGDCSGADLLSGLLFGHGAQWVAPAAPAAQWAASVRVHPGAAGRGGIPSEAS